MPVRFRLMWTGTPVPPAHKCPCPVRFVPSRQTALLVRWWIWEALPAVGSLVWEGSCGSGSLAAALAQSQDAPDGLFVRDYTQPAGVIQVSVLRQNGSTVSASIGGPVKLDSPITVQL